MFTLSRFWILLAFALPTAAGATAAQHPTLKEALQFYQNVENDWKAHILKAEHGEDLWFKVEGTKVTIGTKVCIAGGCETKLTESELIERGGQVYQKMATGEVFLITAVGFRRIELTDIHHTELEKSIYDLYRQEKILRYSVTPTGERRLRRESILSEDGFTYSKSTYFFSGRSKSRNSCRALF